MTNMKPKPLLDPNKELFRWGPTPMHFLYASSFVEAIRLYFPKRYEGFRWPATVSLYRDGKMAWVNEYPKLRTVGLGVFQKYILPVDMRTKIKQEWYEKAQSLEMVQEKIRDNDLSLLTEEQLLSLWNELQQAYLDFWVVGVVPELGNYGSEALLAEQLGVTISDPEERARVMEVLTTPEESSFYQREEIDLAKTADIAAHHQRYFWLRNSYGGVQVLPIEFFVERKEHVSSDLEDRLKQKFLQIQERKQAIIKQYGLSQSVVDIADGLCAALTWQDERKASIFQVLHYTDLLLKEVTQRYGYTITQLYNAWYWEISEIIKGKDLYEMLTARIPGVGIEFYEDIRMLDTEETFKQWEIFVEEVVTEGEELKGVIASRGDQPIVKGKVCIVVDPREVQSFEKGDILVAPMTSPDYVFLMKNSAAVVTDAGGLTSHAAIVSRELGIPCIVGTRVATKVLKDGDMVEVDADKGIVKKL